MGHVSGFTEAGNIPRGIIQKFPKFSIEGSRFRRKEISSPTNEEKSPILGEATPVAFFDRPRKFALGRNSEVICFGVIISAYCCDYCEADFQGAASWAFGRRLAKRLPH